MAGWPSGKAEACKAFTTGSNPVPASIFADMAQLVEHNLAKVGVAGSSPVVRSRIFNLGFCPRFFVVAINTLPTNHDKIFFIAHLIMLPKGANVSPHSTKPSAQSKILTLSITSLRPGHISSHFLSSTFSMSRLRPLRLVA